MLNAITNTLVAALAGLVALVLTALAWIEDNFTAMMDTAGVPHQVQGLLALVIAVLFLVAAVRLFSGFIRIVLVFVLLSMVVHAVAYHGPRHVPHVTTRS